MRRRTYSLLCCVVLVVLGIGYLIVGSPSGQPTVNEIPTAKQLEQYNQVIAEVENQQEIEN